MDKPVRLKIDEVTLMFGVARYALKRLGLPDLIVVAARDGLLSSLNAILSRDTYNPLWFLPFFHSISRADLEFLAPYIDEWINGQAPPQNLPAEYPDERPEELRAFKERMQKEGCGRRSPSIHSCREERGSA